MEAKSDIIIVGGGLVGPLLSIALAEAGMQVTVVDALPAPERAQRDFDGRAYALSASSILLLKALGIWDEISGHAQPIREIKVSDGRPGEGASPFFLHVDHREIEDGPFGHMIEDRYLRRCLMERMDATGAAHLASHKVIGLAPGEVTIEGASGTRTLKTSLTVGCDGRNSRVAEWSGIRRTGWPYDQTSLVSAVAHERSHDGIAHQFFTPAGPLAILPLPGNMSSIVWTEASDVAKRINAADDETYLKALRPVFGDFLGELSLVGQRFTYPLGLSLAEQLTAPRTALAGDAGHGIHPLAGQGLNLGIRDVAALAEVLITAARRGEDVGAADVLDRYQVWRRFDIAAMAAFTDGINRTFSNDNPVLRFARDVGMNLLGRNRTLRQATMRQAAGLSGERPRLLRGLGI